MIVLDLICTYVVEINFGSLEKAKGLAHETLIIKGDRILNTTMKIRST